MLLLAAFLIQSLPAAALCCNESDESECCGDDGGCPTLPSGECALVATAEQPAVPVTPATLEAMPASVMVVAPHWSAPLSWIAAAEPASAIPRPPNLSNLRN